MTNPPTRKWQKVGGVGAVDRNDRVLTEAKVLYAFVVVAAAGAMLLGRWLFPAAPEELLLVSGMIGVPFGWMANRLLARWWTGGAEPLLDVRDWVHPLVLIVYIVLLAITLGLYAQRVTADRRWEESQREEQRQRDAHIEEVRKADEERQRVNRMLERTAAKRESAAATRESR